MSMTTRPFWIDPERIQVNWERCLGKGGTASVFEGSWNDLPIAVKCYHSPTLALREISLLQQLRHPCIIQYFGCSQHHSFRGPWNEYTDLLLVLERLPQQKSLSHWIRDSKRLTFSQKKQVCQQICSVMMYLDNMKWNKFWTISFPLPCKENQSPSNFRIFHKDLKLSNIFVYPSSFSSKYLHVKIIDFGLSLLQFPHVSDQDIVSWEEVRSGTTEFMDPWIITSTPTNFTWNDIIQAELWTLGCVIYCLWENLSHPPQTLSFRWTPPSLRKWFLNHIFHPPPRHPCSLTLMIKSLEKTFDEISLWERTFFYLTSPFHFLLALTPYNSYPPSFCLVSNNEPE